MIGQIRGIILEKQPPQLIVDVHGIGYEIDAPMSTFYQLPDTGQEVSLYTHFIVREDAHHLYGFYTRDERALFKTLLKVNGVGPRLALTILSSTATEEFVRCVLNNDTASLVRLPGVGKKTAERLVIEMRDKLSDWHRGTPQEGAMPMTQDGQGRHQILQDAIAALIALGYKQQEATRTITKVDDGALNSEELIRRALREMM
ncbi:Holliday junction branch migration protein RuvA [Aquicella lusitana]|uniref:Holliday junction branch migration complex subunit RuvA n=1 Tax=Aquicella lusitana TaxID=254246 RepID=A0A370GDR0_9COXI|nr:Holliday junction branch migration protein RuvA [Aquicella lusitana]RDI41827.1 Holliday junction DNA helicase subunit RuvA [Aquicella lusitana]VVC73735.1 Holliday junction ATP-dependent DNA helicase RuvA [Aquicella lusitana]